MTGASVTPIAPRTPSKLWRIFDVALVIFIVCDLLFAIPASFFATYRVGSEPLLFEVFMMLFFAATLWLLGIDLLCLIVRAFRKRLTAFSIIVFICLGAHLFFVHFFFGAGRAYGRHLLAKRGINERVAQECLLIAQSDLCRTDVWILGVAGTLTAYRDFYGRTPLASGLETQYPSIAGLKPTRIFCNPSEVSIELHGGFDHYGYRFLVEGTNWVLHWYTEASSDEVLIRLPHEMPSIILNNSGTWQTQSN